MADYNWTEHVRTTFGQRCCWRITVCFCRQSLTGVIRKRLTQSLISKYIYSNGVYNIGGAGSYTTHNNIKSTQPFIHSHAPSSPPPQKKQKNKGNNYNSHRNLFTTKCKHDTQYCGDSSVQHSSRAGTGTCNLLFPLAL